MILVFDFFDNTTQLFDNFFFLAFFCLRTWKNKVVRFDKYFVKLLFEDFPGASHFLQPLYSKNLKGKPYATKQMFVRNFHLSVCISCRSVKCQNILENYQTN